MLKSKETRLTAKREAYRLWFEYLKVALKSSNPKVKDALTIYKGRYREWGVTADTKFDPWWKTHGHLFEEKFIVKRLAHDEAPNDTTALIVEIPLNQSPTILTRKVKAIIQEAFEEQQRLNKKKKGKQSAAYRLTEGAEPKLLAVREMLTVYEKVYLKNKNLKGQKLLKAVHDYYLGRRSKKFQKIPTPLMLTSGRTEGDDLARALRNMNRYIARAEKIVLNVAKGEFPGKY